MEAKEPPVPAPKPDIKSAESSAVSKKLSEGIPFYRYRTHKKTTEHVKRIKTAMAKVNIKPPSWAEELSDEDFKKMVSAKLNFSATSAAASLKKK